MSSRSLRCLRCARPAEGFDGCRGPGDGRRCGRGRGGRCGHRGRRVLRQRGCGGRGVCGARRAALSGVHQRGGAGGAAGPDRCAGRRAGGPAGHHRRTERGDGAGGRAARPVPADQLLLPLAGRESSPELSTPFEQGGSPCQRGVQAGRLRAGAGLLRAAARHGGGAHQPGVSAGRNRPRLPGVGGRRVDRPGAPAGGRGNGRRGTVHRRAAPPGPRGPGAYAGDGRADDAIGTATGLKGGWWADTGPRPGGKPRGGRGRAAHPDALSAARGPRDGGR